MEDFYSLINKYRQKNIGLVLITVTNKEGMGPADVGKKMLVLENGESFGTVGGGAIEKYAQNRAKDAIKNHSSFSEVYVLQDKNVHVDNGETQLLMACGGKATLFYEYIGPKQYVYIFGGGHCGAALAKVLKPLEFYITVIDPRKDVLDAIDSSTVDEKVCSDFVEYVSNKNIKSDAYIVVCTPSHQFDYEVLDKLVETKLPMQYFGMLCSKKKKADYISRLLDKYGDIELNNFYSPIGLDIGGTSPEEIAISISSEILAVYYQKGQVIKHMKDR